MTGRALTIDITTRDQQTLAALKRVQKELSAVDKAVDKTANAPIKPGEPRHLFVGAMPLVQVGTVGRQ